jgi:hypothetical protein
VLAAMLVMLSVGLTISRGLSPIIKAYAEITLGKIGDYNLTQELLRNARIYLENGEYSRSILYATTTVDYEMRRRFSILAPYSFPTLIHQLVQCGSDKLSTENIETMIMLRNKADQVKCKCEQTTFWGFCLQKP